MLRVEISRWLNHYIFGGRRDECLCSRLYRERRYGWVTAVDFFWLIFAWRVRHCYRNYVWERNERMRGRHALKAVLRKEVSKAQE